MNLGQLVSPRRTGREDFHDGTVSLGTNLLDFWQWSVSDLVSNATRGRLAEFIVARALGGPWTAVRDEWAAFDLETPDGIRIEVKSAAYLQAWHQRELTRIVFQTPATRAWDPETNVQSEIVVRQASVYVFALRAHQDKSTIDPLNIDQWRFYAVPTETLNRRTRSQQSITLKSLEGLCASVRFHELAEAVRQAASNKGTVPSTAASIGPRA